MARRAQHPLETQPAPFAVGDSVRGPEALPPGDRRTPETHEGEVVQVGSGWDGVDSADTYLWVRLPNRTERKLSMPHCARLPPDGRP
ncbi:hypothetical protein AB0469_40610 [Streptomyces sp. NPDC093801]|uniref:hypothetical protein n=1 Tax=Streptomyces sp. NPDC093801 TaxID=3155203 RepID=UPI00344F6666